MTTIVRLKTTLLAATALAALAAHPAFAADLVQLAAADTQVVTGESAPQATSKENWVQLAQNSTIYRAEPGQTQIETVTVTARRRVEDVQSIPVAVSVVSAQTLDNAGAYNLSKVAQLQPTLQFFTQNPRNTSVNIRGIGAPLGLTNDGIEQGVGVYVDQVYYNRVAATTLDFVDISQIEVLRGPQGTLYGKNTTAGAINVTTKAPNFEAFEGKAEFSAGNLNLKQAKVSISAPLADDLAFRLSASHTTRRGAIWNVTTNQWINGQDNLGLRGVLAWRASEALDLTFSADFNLQDAPNSYGQVYVRTGLTQKALNRQYASLAQAFNYKVPSTNGFDRLADIDAPLKARSELGGASVRAEWKLGTGQITSVSSWRYWDWQPRNDRDYTGLPITPNSNNPTHQNQYTQEVRYNYDADNYDFVVGAFGFYQGLHTKGLESNGPAASRWTLNPGNVAVGAPGCATPTTRACNPAVLNNLTAQNDITLKNTSAAIFGKLNYKLTDALTVSPGIRFNYDEKKGSYSSIITGTASDGTRQLVLFTGPYANDAWIVEERGVRAPQFYTPNLAKLNVSYDLNVAYKIDPDLLVYGTYAKTFKTAGINLNGLPADAAGTPILAAATIKPESENHFEVGAKSQFLDRRVTLNVTGFWTNIKNYQANVNNAALGLVRGYLANAGEVQVRGVETDLQVLITDGLTAYTSGAYTDHQYLSFVDAPCPPELSGGNTGTPISAPGTPGGNSPANCNISGQWLPGISKWALSWGGEYSTPFAIATKSGSVFLGYDASYRSKFSSNASRSAYTDVDGYALHNFRLGFRADDGFNLSLWVRNAFDQDYYEQLIVTPSNNGLIVGQPADPRTYGLTVGFKF